MAGNSNSGRRPAPTAIKLLKGDPNKNRINLNEPKPPQGEVIKPQMSPMAGVVWDRVAPICLHMGTLTVSDVDAFKGFCEVQARMDVCDDVNQLIKLAESLRKYYAMFGLEPSARARLKVVKAEKPASKWAGLVG
jgi:phage terminase small subunit